MTSIKSWEKIATQSRQAKFPRTRWTKNLSTKHLLVKHNFPQNNTTLEQEGKRDKKSKLQKIETKSKLRNKDKNGRGGKHKKQDW